MLLERCGTLLQFSGIKQLVNFPVHWNKGAGIIMTAVYQHHAHPQFTDHISIKRIQPLIPM